MANNISIKFGKPEAGWLPIHFKTDDIDLEFEASNVMNDPLNEFIHAIFLLKSGLSSEVICWLEAPTYYFHFARTEDIYTLTISESDDYKSKKRTLHIIKGDYDLIVKPFKEALLQFCDEKYEKRDWDIVSNKKVRKLASC